MRPETEFEKWQRLEMPQRLHGHQMRLESWERIKEAWPNGLTCPKCGADHCEVDGHICKDLTNAN